MKRLSLFLAVVCFASVAHATPEVWTPKAEFSLEGNTLKETMLWVSGWSYALTEVGKSSSHSGQKPLFCLPPEGYIGSREMFQILNTQFKGKRITSEQAAAALWSGVIAKYPCGKNQKD